MDSLEQRIEKLEKKLESLERDHKNTNHVSQCGWQMAHDNGKRIDDIVNKVNKLIFRLATK